MSHNAIRLSAEMSLVFVCWNSQSNRMQCDSSAPGGPKCPIKFCCSTTTRGIGRSGGQACKCCSTHRSASKANTFGDIFAPNLVPGNDMKLTLIAIPFKPRPKRKHDVKGKTLSERL